MRNPIRRSRKIGETQGGRVTSGVPQKKASRIFTRDIWARLSDEEIHEGYWVLVENPSRDYFHPIGEAEIRTTLEKLPNKLTAPPPRRRLTKTQGC